SIKSKVLMYQNSFLMSGFQGRSPYKPPPAVDRSTGRWIYPLQGAACRGCAPENRTSKSCFDTSKPCF
ncbi:hypothetical protein, partial [Aeromonas hydrophila]|uniref:hypothetical protein n=1 Tax=Aeromonas hydrophila TaxID=644 RepID=UPI001CC45757